MAFGKEPGGRKETNVTIAAVLIIAGVVALAAQLLRIPIGEYLWPFWVLVPGVALVVLGLSLKDGASEPVTIVGTLVTVTGGLLFMQNVTGLWASWAYAWALVGPAGVGLAQIVYGAIKDNQQKIQEGSRSLRAGLWMFVVGFVFFELVLGISGFGLGQGAWPIALIALGAIMLVRNVITRRKQEDSPEAN